MVAWSHCHIAFAFKRTRVNVQCAMCFPASLHVANGQRSCPPNHNTINVFGFIENVFLMNSMTVLSSGTDEGDNVFPCNLTTNAGRKIPSISSPVVVCDSNECDHWPNKPREKVDPS